MIKLKNENYNAILTEIQLKISASSSDKTDKHEYLESYNGGFGLVMHTKCSGARTIKKTLLESYT